MPMLWNVRLRLGDSIRGCIHEPILILRSHWRHLILDWFHSTSTTLDHAPIKLILIIFLLEPLRRSRAQ